MAARELERAVADGCRGAFTLPFTWNRLPHGHQFFDPFWSAAERVGVPIGLHPRLLTPLFANTLTRFVDHDSSPGVGGPGAQFMSNIVVRHGMQQALRLLLRIQHVGAVSSPSGWVCSNLVPGGSGRSWIEWTRSPKRRSSETSSS